MKRSLKLALLPAAVAGVLASGQAFAGSEACFEVYPSGDVAPAAHDTLYSLATCEVGVASDTEVQAISTSSIAAELTADYDFDFEDTNADGPGPGDDVHIVYIPTTDIPPGTIITIELSNATFVDNGNQLHMASSDGSNYTLVASSDGTFDGESTVTFLTKGAIIGAGTRLALTTNNGADGAAVADFATAIIAPKINLANEGCPTNSTVTIAATSAITDGGTGFNIAGGVSDASDLLEVVPQFYFANDVGEAPVSGSVEVVAERVDAELPSARTLFLTEAGDMVANNGQVVYSTFGMVDIGGTLDTSITIGSDDKVGLHAVASSTPGDAVQFGLAEDANLALDAFNPDAGTYVDLDADTDPEGTDPDTFATKNLAFGSDLKTAMVELDGDAVFAAPGETVWHATLANTDTDQVMNFNYTVDMVMDLDFDDATYLDHCAYTVDTFDIGVNGAVLKVPYTYDTKANFIRITNEHTSAGSVSLDIMDESGNKTSGIDIGTIGMQSSVVYEADALIDTAIAAGYAGTGKRHTMTFTVTAPSNTVHGVSVQKIPGGVDRVMPVLDMNDWRQ